MPIRRTPNEHESRGWGGASLSQRLAVNLQNLGERLGAAFPLILRRNQRGRPLDLGLLASTSAGECIFVI